MKSSQIILLLFCFTLLSCNDFFECLIDRRPELPNKEFPIGDTETYYYVDLRAEINNEPRDDDYDYFFEFSDPLPEGLDFFINYRTISIEGTPREAGIYRITLNVFVDGPFRNGFVEDETILCDYSATKTYTLIIE
ncbi:hypothetical protein J4050_11625 [Winogradskyella sp. DF17]|uniref:Lipoprotein n=1 Tax=Winogradskyella pelagia TaxID=2819984 RepID=A0ABS3T6A4_9FLAO|nr:hypothetical protein [Winogradskyella sp. DF17]MBO3117401.1 hypothetical protein [Winogradskyella sp. DF17]